MSYNYLGESAALSAAGIWAIASIVYTKIGQQLSPLALNLAKGLIAIVLLIFTLALSGQLLPPVEPRAWLLLLFSGIVGIGIGDTAYFTALNTLGARRSLVLESLSPPLTALLGLTFLGERLSVNAWGGIVLTVGGVLLVVLERSSIQTGQPKTALQTWKGIVGGLVAAVGQAVGAVLSRAALAGTEINPLWSTLIRLIAGGGVLAVVLLLRQNIQQEFAPLRSRRLLGVLVGAAFASTYLAITLQQVSLKYAPAGIAQALSATSPLFVLPIVAILGEKVSGRAVLGILGAIVGIWLLFPE
jgi:drug/metabolite transporter (DMT)-like permease